jgi:hypothetical protein
MAESRCIWSGQVSKKAKALDVALEHKGEKIQLYALPDYEPKARAFVTYYQRYHLLFQRLMGVGLALVVLSMFSGRQWLEGLAWGLLGITFLIFPFAINPSFQGMSLRTAVIVARVLGVAFLLMSGVFIFDTLN